MKNTRTIPVLIVAILALFVLCGHLLAEDLLLETGRPEALKGDYLSTVPGASVQEISQRTNAAATLIENMNLRSENAGSVVIMDDIIITPTDTYDGPLLVLDPSTIIITGSIVITGGDIIITPTDTYDGPLVTLDPSTITITGGPVFPWGNGGSTSGASVTVNANNGFAGSSITLVDTITIGISNFGIEQGVINNSNPGATFTTTVTRSVSLDEATPPSEGQGESQAKFVRDRVEKNRESLKKWIGSEAIEE